MQTPVALQAISPRDSWSPDTRGLNFYDIDRPLQDLLGLYLPPALLAHLQPHLRRLGGMVGNELDDLAHLADQNPPTLSHRNRRGEDFQVLEKHPAYRELERLAFGEFGLAAMSHRGGVLDWPEPLPANAKYALTYLFVQSEFGLCCPVNMTDSLTRTVRCYADPALTQRVLDTLTSTDMDELSQGAMFITEQHGGSDVGVLETEARMDDGQWRLYGEKWFCSNVDAALSLVLARPQGAGPGTRNLGLFLLPRDLPAGGRNRYRIVRLKDKLGSRSMASGEILLEGALAFLVGDLGRGFVQMTEMINASRLSNGVRAAGLMRRSLTEALHVARNRVAFAKPLIELPLMQRQLLKLAVPTEQALSMALFTGDTLQRADEGDQEARGLLRILTPLIKFRATRDARKVAADAMEVRGGSGYIEEWAHPRIIRDSLLGSVWEGTSNIVALDMLRAVRREGADAHLERALRAKLDEARGVPPALRARLAAAREAALAFVRRLAADKSRELHTRQAASALYSATAATLLAWEGHRLAERRGDARRMLAAALVCKTRLEPVDPLAEDDPAWETRLARALFADAPLPLAEAQSLLEPAG
ncbi:MAG: acyl-CoA dehydrogenase family protein [Candidatus Lambdaproteobacteria bacterium]|nr:acyl-CoA dehydrogenase family protein [Candidatus Lambdaproteobacteria bacterium]